jgi:hypothetical protein
MMARSLVRPERFFWLEVALRDAALLLQLGTGEGSLYSFPSQMQRGAGLWSEGRSEPRKADLMTGTHTLAVEDRAESEGE